jgi:hypothetical protein
MPQNSSGKIWGQSTGTMCYQRILPVFNFTRLSIALFSTGLFYFLSFRPSLYSLCHVSLICSTVRYCIFLLIEAGLDCIFAAGLVSQLSCCDTVRFDVLTVVKMTMFFFFVLTPSTIVVPAFRRNMLSIFRAEVRYCSHSVPRPQHTPKFHKTSLL